AVFVRDIIDFCDGKSDLPPKPVVLTFDDGFYNNFYYAEKIAREYGMKIVVSVVGAYAQNECGQNKRSPVYSYLNAEEIAKMQAGGNVEFCNHTFDLHRVTAERKGLRRKKSESDTAYENLIVSDSERCRDFLRGACGYTVNVFTYPFGCYSRETNGILQKLGYRAVLTCKGGINVFRKGSTEGLYGIMRYNRTGKTPTEKFFASIEI
ncbi:MAG: polysaccharide deacetylase family protein, partial [Clostridiales bacterium]|nr:polysaccharide deacetylase family protein [Clostridiales bacterium]